VDSLIRALESSGLRSSSGGADLKQVQSDAFKLITYIRAFMTHGHLNADLDPLKLDTIVGGKFMKPNQEHLRLLDITHYGFTEADLDRTFIIDLPNMKGLFGERKQWSLREVRNALEKAYCGQVGIEYMHITSPEEANWIREHVETRQFHPLSEHEKIQLLDRLYWADEFSQFIS
jgi:2-oxoglutarate dehydrogenase E1 component